MKKVGRAKTGTSGTGSSRKNRTLGFTLLELIIVMSILALMTGLLTVRMVGVLSGGDLPLASRMVIGEINALRGKAVSTRQPQTLLLDVDDEAIYPVVKISPKQDVGEWKSDEEKTASEVRHLPQGVDLQDVVLLSEEKIQEGEASIRFFANGCVDRALIHLRNEDNDVYTLEINPLTGHVRIYDSYVEQIYGD